MKKDNLLTRLRLIALMLFAVASTSFTAYTGSVTIEITNLRNNNGHILVSLYNAPESFPKDGEKAIGKGKIPITAGKAIITFKNLPKGEYAAAILHDENNNLKMDYTGIGMPKEGYGFSNNAKGFMGPPSFSKAAFTMDGPVKNIAIKATYFSK